MLLNLSELKTSKESKQFEVIWVAIEPGDFSDGFVEYLEETFSKKAIGETLYKDSLKEKDVDNEEYANKDCVILKLYNWPPWQESECEPLSDFVEEGEEFTVCVRVMDNLKVDADGNKVVNIKFDVDATFEANEFEYEDEEEEYEDDYEDDEDAYEDDEGYDEDDLDDDEDYCEDDDEDLDDDYEDAEEDLGYDDEDAEDDDEVEEEEEEEEDEDE